MRSRKVYIAPTLWDNTPQGYSCQFNRGEHHHVEPANNADAGMFAKAFQDYAAEAPFQYLAMTAGGDTPREQAFEDMYWALVNCTEFLTNH